MGASRNFPYGREGAKAGNGKRYTVAIDTGCGGTKFTSFRHPGSKKNEQEPESYPIIVLAELPT